MKKRMLEYVLVSLTAVLLAGCGDRQTQSLWDDIAALKKENTDLTAQVQSLQAENNQLAEQTQTLSGLDKSVRLAELDTLDKIRIGKHTGLSDTNKDGKPDTLMVHLETLDTAQDYVKAIGTVTVELWNLNAKPAEAKLGEWTLEPADMHKHWGGNIFASYYRLPFDVANILKGGEKELTVKVIFTDSLSGKVCRDQKVFTP